MPGLNTTHVQQLVSMDSRERFQGLDNFDINEYLEYFNKLIVPSKLQDLFDLLDTIKEKKISSVIYLLRRFLTYQLAHGSFTPHIQSNFLNIEEENFPLNIDPTQPKPLIDIMEVLNAMWHGEQALEYLETKEISNKIVNYTFNMFFSSYGLQPFGIIIEKMGKFLGIWSNNNEDLPELPEEQVLLRLYYDVANHIYQAFWSLTHINVKNTLNLIFEEELKEYFIPLFHLISDEVGIYLNKASDFFHDTQYLEFTYDLGLACGITVDQLKPHTGQLDMHYIVSFTQTLPDYIERINDHIKNITNQVLIEQSPSENKVDEQKAKELLQALDKIQNDSSILSAPHYVTVVKYMITLVKELIQEVKTTHELSQELIKIKLQELKYKFIPNLLSFMDKVEKTGLIAKGTITQPLFQKLDDLYTQIIKICTLVVDFDEDDPLLHLADARLMAIRFEPMFRQMARNLKSAITEGDATEIAHRFFRTISLYEDNKFFHQIPTDEYDDLILQLTTLKSFICELDMPIYIRMIRILNGQNRDNSLEISRVTALQEKVKNLILQKRATYEFDSELAQDILYNAYDITELSLQPYSVMNYDIKVQGLTFGGRAQSVCLLEDEILDIEVLQLEHVRELVKKLIDDLIADKDIVVIRNMYAQIQSHFGKIEHSQAMIDKDRQIVSLLNSDNYINAVDDIVIFLRWLDTSFEEKLIDLDDTRTILLNEDHGNQLIRSNELPLAESWAYVSNDDAYSQGLHKICKLLENFSNIFNNCLQSDLRGRKSNKLPFPEMRNTDTRLSQASQVLVAKNLANLFYHLYKGTKRLELLRNDDDKMVYVGNVMKGFAHFNQALNYIKNLNNNLVIKKLFGDAAVNVQAMFAIAKQEFSLYSTQEAVHNPALHFALNVLKIFPQRIKALHENKDFNEEVITHANDRAKVTINRINNIVNASHSYFRLFLTTPQMYKLFVELQKAVAELSEVTNTVVKERLSYIKNDIFYKMLALADEYEYTLGLRSGIISNNLNDVCFSYFEGLIQPLGLTSKEFLSYLSSVSIIESRQEKITAFKNQANFDHDLLLLSKMEIEKFLSIINKFKAKRSLWHKILDVGKIFSWYSGPTQDNPFDRLNAAYEKIVNMLLANDSFDLINFYNINFEKSLDEMIAEPSPRKKLGLLERFAKLYITYYDGLINTKHILIQSIHEKSAHLKEHKRLEEKSDEQFLIEFIKNIIEQQTIAYLKESKYFSIYKEEYKNSLFEFIHECSADLILKVRDSDDILTAVNIVLPQVIDEFHQRNNYSKLERLKQVISELDSYLSSMLIENTRGKSSAYEDATTLHNKKVLVEKLKNIAYQQNTSVEIRLNEIEDFITSPDNRFEQTLLTEKDNYSCFEVILRLVLKIFELIGYQPEHARYCSKMKQEIANNTNIESASLKFSMFHNPRGYSLPAEDSILDCDFLRNDAQSSTDFSDDDSQDDSLSEEWGYRGDPAYGL